MFEKIFAWACVVFCFWVDVSLSEQGTAAQLAFAPILFIVTLGALGLTFD